MRIIQEVVEMSLEEPKGLSSNQCCDSLVLCMRGDSTYNERAACRFFAQIHNEFLQCH